METESNTAKAQGKREKKTEKTVYVGAKPVYTPAGYGVDKIKLEA